jgi:topoisomerase-4 subunit A
MKAQGNRLSQHEIRKVTLLTEEEDLNKKSNDLSSKNEAADTDEPETDFEGSEDGSGDDGASGGENSTSEEPIVKPKPKVDFEITNPDDIDLDDNGQQSLF